MKISFLVYFLVLSSATIAFATPSEEARSNASSGSTATEQQLPTHEENLSKVNTCIDSARAEKLDPWTCYTDSVPLSREAFRKHLNRAGVRIAENAAATPANKPLPPMEPIRRPQPDPFEIFKRATQRSSSSSPAK